MSFFKKIKDKIASTFNDNSDINSVKKNENIVSDEIEINTTSIINEELTEKQHFEEVAIEEKIENDFDNELVIENIEEEICDDVLNSNQVVDIKDDIEKQFEEEIINNESIAPKSENQIEEIIENIEVNDESPTSISIADVQTQVVDEAKSLIVENVEEKSEIQEEKVEKKSFFQKTSGFFSSVVEKTTEAVKSTLGIEKIKEGLSKTRKTFSDSLRKTLGFGRKIDESLLSEIEELLITADIGVDTTEQLIESLRLRVKKENYENAEDLYNLLKEEIEKILIKSPSANNDKIYEIDNVNKPFVILVIGVNGVGKTTTIGKLAHNYQNVGKNVIIGAADTFRAAANEQLEIWAERAKVDIVQQKQGADPAAVAFDTLKSAQAKDKDIVIIDTAGRLHNKTHLMAELDKISRVMKKLKADAPNEVYLILDATTGQNAIFQAKEFAKVAPLTGIILTKLDGTAKGGVVIPIANELKIPVRYIGVGEKIDDLQIFDPKAFVDALFDANDSIEDNNV